MSKIYKGGEVINETDSYVLTLPKNNWDMNYHLHEKESGKDFLVDIGDVQDTEEEVEEYGGILFCELSTMEDIESIKEVSWKTV